jgi:cytidylate kinase
MLNDYIITIDGPAGSGKSTVSRLLATKMSILYLDTGAMYRAVALAADRKGINLDDGKRLGTLCNDLKLKFRTDSSPPRLYLDGDDISETIRQPEMDMASSEVSRVSEVRKAMTGLQRKMAQGVSLVAEGRDMGTVVFPHAKYKFFLTATSSARAERRYLERRKRGESVTRKDVASDLKMRDYQDENRSLAPLRPAPDAQIIDTTELNAEQVVEKILGLLD